MKFFVLPEAPHYEINNLGIVRNKENKKILRGSVNSAGYTHHGFRLGFKKRKFFAVHVLMAKMFVSGHRDGLQVNHKNGVKTDNYLGNLEWVTPQENSRHRDATGLSPSLKGSAHHGAKLEESEIIQIRKLLKKGVRLKTLSEIYGVSSSLISRIKTRSLWKHI